MRSTSEAPSAERRAPSILRDRAFRRFWAGETISVFGSTISEFAISIVAVVTLQATPGQMGILRSLGGAPSIVLGLIAGTWVDRVSRKRLLVALDLCAALLIVSVPVAYALGVLSLGHLFALALAFGVLDAFWSPAWNAFLPSVVRGDRLLDANSKLMLSWSASGMVGPGLAGALVEILSAPVTMIVDALSYLVSAVFVAGVPAAERTDAGAAQIEAGSTARRISEGLRTAFLDPLQRSLTVPATILHLVDGMSMAVYVIYVLREVGLSPAALGGVAATAAAGFLAGSTFAPRIGRRLGAGRATILGLALVGASPFSMILAGRQHSLVANLVFLSLPGLIGGFGGVIQCVTIASIRQAITPERLIGRVSASVGVVGAVATVVGALAGGALGEVIGLRPTIATVACAYTIPALLAPFTALRTAALPADGFEER